MPFELVREYMTIDQEVNTVDTQTSIEELIKIPDYKPNIRNVLSVRGSVNVASQSIEDNILDVEGEATYKVYYIAEGGYLESTQVSVPYDYSMELKELSGDIDCLIKSSFEHIDYRVTNSRKINVRSILHIEGKVIKKNNFPILTDVKELNDIQKLQDKITVTKSAVKNKERVSIKDTFTTEETDETSLRFIDATVQMEELKTSKSPSGILISGKASISALYIAEEEDKKEYKKLEDSIPFTHFIEKKELDNIDNYFCNPYISNQKFDFSTDEINQQVILNAEILMDVDVIMYENIQIENIQDLYSPLIHTSVEKDEVNAYHVVSDFSDSFNASDEIMVSADRQLEQVLSVESNVAVTDITVNGKYIQVQGVIENTIIAKMISDPDLIEKIDKDVSFTYNINVNTEGYEIADFSILSHSGDVTQRGNSIMISQDVVISGNLSEKVKLNMINTIDQVETTESDVTGEFYSIKAYYKQPGDSMWDIAKYNSTTIEKILKDNQIEKEENVEDYTPLVIIK